jgi:hypothetical protein
MFTLSHWDPVSNQVLGGFLDQPIRHRSFSVSELVKMQLLAA